MKTLTTALALSLTASATLAEEGRALDAHVHGVTEVQIAVDGTAVDIRMKAPGMDIVGFEHAATGDADKAAVDAALAQLRDPGSSVALDAAAGCSIREAEAALLSNEDHEDHGEDDHGHEDHAEADDHGHDDHDDHKAGHSAFEAHYQFTCDTPDALRTIAFPFFASFPNAEEIEAQHVTEAGAGAAEITADAPQLVLN